MHEPCSLTRPVTAPVKTILENGQEKAIGLHDAPLPAIYSGKSRFQRNTNDLI